MSRSQKSGFANIDDTFTETTNEFLSVMDKYGPSSSSGSNSRNKIQLYRKSDLDNENSNSQGCKMDNMKDYNSNSVG